MHLSEDIIAQEPYHLIINLSAVNCTWSDWEVSDCSVTCAGGTFTKTRSKTVTEQFGGTCEGESFETVECNTQDCPRNETYI